MRFTHDARQQYAMSSARIRRELGYREVVEHDESLRRTLAWERAHPPETVEPDRFDYTAEDAVLAGLAS
jgi:dTDP-D-glucose 4,6-dehydratase